MTASSVEAAPGVLKLLADDRRWMLVRALAHSDRRVQELVDLVRLPANLVSYHLRRLRDQAVVTERRSAADRRDIYYSLAFDRVRALYFAAAESLHPSLGPPGPAAARNADIAARNAAAARPRPASVLFVCTHNSARSQMAEGFLRHSRPDLTVESAGTEVSQVQPLAIRVMKKRGIDIGNQRSQHLSELKPQRFDYIVTVCDRAREECPVFPGNPELLHWSIGDPSQVTGDGTTRRQAYETVADELQGRIRRFLALLFLDQR
jgi:ArsR family transcriptional regulator, arsenate/arsenite/antimonite-responsive transcriptional repressor / arsenate reductase (thioredoxin)